MKIYFRSILTNHATVTHKGKVITIVAHPDAKVMVNGKPAQDETEIHHNDRYINCFKRRAIVFQT